MHSTKRYLLIALSFAVAVATFAAFTPKIAHAITATLVQVVNTTSNPVPTQAVGNTTVQGTVGIDPNNNAVTISSAPDPARQAFTLRASCFIAPGSSSCTAQISVPAGKRAVIQSVSYLEESSPQAPTLIDLHTYLQGDCSTCFNDFHSYFAANRLAGFGSVAGTWQTQAYADPGEPVEIQFSYPAANSASYAPGQNAFINGYYVDMP